jgi:hypothetical protein
MDLVAGFGNLNVAFPIATGPTESIWQKNLLLPLMKVGFIFCPNVDAAKMTTSADEDAFLGKKITDDLASTLFTLLGELRPLATNDGDLS